MDTVGAGAGAGAGWLAEGGLVGELGTAPPRRWADFIA